MPEINENDLVRLKSPWWQIIPGERQGTVWKVHPIHHDRVFVVFPEISLVPQLVPVEDLELIG